MPLLRLLSPLLLLSVATTVIIAYETQTLRVLAAKPSFEWIEDPHAADPCTLTPDCVNHIKYGFTIVPMNISSDLKIVLQEAARPKGFGAELYLDIFTQPGCVISACTTSKFLGLFSREDCFNAFGAEIPNQPDNVTALVKFGGNYFEHVPAGELYAKFELKNYLTEKKTCTFEVRDGFKRWY